MDPLLPPLLILAIGIITILMLIVVLRTHAFLALIMAAMLVSTLAGGPWEERIGRVATEFGVAAGKIGIVIALAAIIGQCMMESGAADRVVRSFLNAFGQQRAGVALLGSGYVLGVPVFFDTVFYLLVPLARSLYQRTGRDFLKYVLAISAGGALTHTLVPPTPGPLTMAAYLEVDIGLLILVGAAVAFPAAVVGLGFANVANRLMPIPARTIGSDPAPVAVEESRLPGLFVSILPVVLPVVLISGRTALEAISSRTDRSLEVAWTVRRDGDARQRELGVTPFGPGRHAAVDHAATIEFEPVNSACRESPAQRRCDYSHHRGRWRVRGDVARSPGR